MNEKMNKTKDVESVQALYNGMLNISKSKKEELSKHEKVLMEFFETRQSGVRSESRIKDILNDSWGSNQRQDELNAAVARMPEQGQISPPGSPGTRETSPPGSPGPTGTGQAVSGDI